MSTPEEVAYQRRLAEAARRKAVQKAAQQAVNAARTSGLKVSLQLAKQARREAHSPYAGQRMMWVNGFRNGDGTWTSGHWRRNPNPAIAPAALEASKAAAGARGVAPAIRDLMARAPLMDRHLDARGLQRQYQGRLAPWQRGDWAYKGQEARAGGRPQDPMQPVINDVAGALNPGIVGLGIASAVNSVRASAREGEWGAVAGEVGLVAATAAVPMAPKGAQLDALGRYSRLRRAAEQLPDKAPAEQMLGILRNAPLSPEEITWTNTDKFLVGATMAEHDAARTASGPSAAAVKRSAEIAALGDKIRAATGDEKKALIARRQELAAANKAELEADIAARARAKAGGNQPDPANRTVTRDEVLRHLDDSALKIADVRYGKAHVVDPPSAFAVKVEDKYPNGDIVYSVNGPGNQIYEVTYQPRENRIVFFPVGKTLSDVPPGAAHEPLIKAELSRATAAVTTAPDAIASPAFTSYSDHARDNLSYRERLYQWQPPEVAQAQRAYDEAVARTGKITSPEAQAARDALDVAKYMRLHLPPSHWHNASGVVVHTRTATEQILNGNGKDLTWSDKTHDVKEIQTDWGQNGRDGGFKPSPEDLAAAKTKLETIEKKLEHALDERDREIAAAAKFFKESAGGDSRQWVSAERLADRLEDYANNFGLDREPLPIQEEAFSRAELLRDAASQVAILREEARLARGALNGTPRGPYVTSTENTTRFALEQELINAARNPEVKALTITRGEQVSDRFGHNDDQRAGTAEFYDRIVPKALKEIVGKLDPDAKVLNDVEISNKREGTGSPRTAVILTPKLRERILREGLPYMAAAGIAGFGASLVPSEARADRSLHAATVVARIRARRQALKQR